MNDSGIPALGIRYSDKFSTIGQVNTHFLVGYVIWFTCTVFRYLLINPYKLKAFPDFLDDTAIKLKVLFPP